MESTYSKVKLLGKDYFVNLCIGDKHVYILHDCTQPTDMGDDAVVALVSAHIDDTGGHCYMHIVLPHKVDAPVFAAFVQYVSKLYVAEPFPVYKINNWYNQTKLICSGDKWTDYDLQKAFDKLTPMDKIRFLADYAKVEETERPEVARAAQIIAANLGSANVAGKAHDLPRRTVEALYPIIHWHCYPCDSGHSIMGCVVSDKRPDVKPDRMVPIPVATMLRLGWRMVGEYVVVDATDQVYYDKVYGLVTPDQEAF